MRVVLIEDNEMLAAGIRKVLCDEGHAVDVINDGQEGYEFLASESADLAIIDLRLPGLGGIEIVKRIRARGDNMPILVLTAMGELSTNRSKDSTPAPTTISSSPSRWMRSRRGVRALARRHEALTPNEETVGELRFGSRRQTALSRVRRGWASSPRNWRYLNTCSGPAGASSRRARSSTPSMALAPMSMRMRSRPRFPA